MSTDARRSTPPKRTAGLPAAVRRSAEGGDGLVTYRTLTGELGYTSGRVTGWVRRGHLVRVHRRVYRVAGAPLTDRARHRASLLRAGGDARLGGVSGLGLLEAGDVRLADHAPFILVPTGSVLHNVDFDWLGAPLDNRDLAIIDGLACTHPERTVIEAAATLAEADALAAVDDLRRRRMVRVDRMVQRAHRLCGLVPGAEHVLAMADRDAFAQESPTERGLAGLFLPTDPIPCYQVRLLPQVRVDAVFLEARLVIEMLSSKWHGLPADRAADAARSAELARQLDVQVLEVWPTELKHPSTLRGRILAARADQLRAGVVPLRVDELPR